MSNTAKITGSCLCGKVRYVITGNPLFAAHCCCTDCQKATGADHGTLAWYRKMQVDITGDLADYAVIADSGNIFTRDFCPTCGGRLFCHNSAHKTTIGITAGSMDNPRNIKPAVVVYARNRREWDMLNQNAMPYDTSFVKNK